MKLVFINESIFELHKSPVEREEFSYTHTHTIYKRIPLFELDFYVVQTYPH